MPLFLNPFGSHGMAAPEQEENIGIANPPRKLGVPILCRPEVKSIHKDLEPL
jgi:hypothetical protein